VNEPLDEWENREPRHVSFHYMIGKIEPGSYFIIYAYSFDPDIADHNDSVTYHWYINEKYVKNGTTLHLYFKDPGKYYITLIAVDSKGGYTEYSDFITVSNPVDQLSESRLGSFFFFFAVIIMLFLIASSLFFLKKKKHVVESGGSENNAAPIYSAPSQDNLIIRAGNLPIPSDKTCNNFRGKIERPSFQIQNAVQGGCETINTRLRPNMLDGAQRPIPSDDDQFDPDILLEKAMEMVGSNDISRGTYEDIKEILQRRKEIKKNRNSMV
jgi:hypothetical protein